MLTDTQAGGGLSLSGLPLKKGGPAQDKGTEARSELQGAFSAILAETDSAKVGADTPLMPKAGGESPDMAPPGTEHSFTRETQQPDTSHVPDAVGRDRGDAEARPREPMNSTTSPPDTVRRDGPATPAQEAPRVRSTAGIATERAAMSPPAADNERSQTAAPEEMTEHGVGAPGPSQARQVVSRDPAAPLPDSRAVSAMSERSGKGALDGGTQPAPAADRPSEKAAAPQLAAPATATAQAAPSRREPAIAVPVPMTMLRMSGIGAPVASPLPAHAPTPSGGTGVFRPGAAFAPDGLSSLASESASSRLSRPEAATRTAEGGGPGRQAGTAMTGSPPLPLQGAPHLGQAPLAGAPGLSVTGHLPQSEHGRTTDAGPGVSDGRGTGQTASLTSLATPAATHRQDLAQQIVVQIAAAAEKAAPGAGRTLDVHLNPEELGRVRLRISPSEAGVSVVILAERGETLDLLRRNIDMLARDFLEIGYEDASFDFAEGRPDREDGYTAPSFQPLADATGPAPESQTGGPNILALGDRLDIRL